VPSLSIAKEYTVAADTWDAASRVVTSRRVPRADRGNIDMMMEG
jgi:hypothetical protein